MNNSIKLPEEFSRENLLEYFREEIYVGFSITYQIVKLREHQTVRLPEKIFIRNIYSEKDTYGETNTIVIEYFRSNNSDIEYILTNHSSLDDFASLFSNPKNFYLGFFNEISNNNKHVFLQRVII
jgi:hypothetical protein